MVGNFSSNLGRPLSVKFELLIVTDALLPPTEHCTLLPLLPLKFQDIIDKFTSPVVENKYMQAPFPALRLLLNAKISVN